MLDHSPKINHYQQNTYPFLLSQEGTGRGTTNGLFKGKRYFKCDSECGVFVSLEKLRLCDATDESLFVKVKNKIVEGISNVFMSPVEQANEETVSEKQDKRVVYKEHDRVWVFINDKPCAGNIRYIGRVPGYDEIFAGIEMVSTVYFEMICHVRSMDFILIFHFILRIVITINRQQLNICYKDFILCGFVL
jgi:hypothetical protein